MKNTLKLILILFLVAIIGFIVGCGKSAGEADPLYSRTVSGTVGNITFVYFVPVVLSQRQIDSCIKNLNSGLSKTVLEPGDSMIISVP